MRSLADHSLSLEPEGRVVRSRSKPLQAFRSGIHNLFKEKLRGDVGTKLRVRTGRQCLRPQPVELVAVLRMGTEGAIYFCEDITSANK
jgi:hypothetical protein